MSGLTYDAIGATRPEDARWGPTPPGYRRHEERARLGHGDEVWARAVRDLLSWSVKSRSGFTVSEPTVRVGPAVLSVRVGPVRVTEPIRVVAVVREPSRVGFAYGTRAGHPVSGEEAFIVERQPDGGVDLVLRSLTAAAPSGGWRGLFPLLLGAQWFYRRRYRRALLP